jgi:hypothetical protein
MSRSKIKFVGIKRKVRRACIILALILLFSSLISIFEFSRMSNYVSDVITDNITSINYSRKLLSTADDYNLDLLYGIARDDGDMTFIYNDEFISSFADLKQSYVTKEERAAADSVLYAYAAYMQVVSEAPAVWSNEDHALRTKWFFNRQQPVYDKLRDYIEDLTNVSQDALITNSQSLQDSFYRSIMPGLISVIFGVLMVMLFNYYLNHYLINPLLKVTKGIKNNRQYNRDYDVKVETDDEIKELNDAVTDIIDVNQSYKRQLKKLQ